MPTLSFDKYQADLKRNLDDQLQSYSGVEPSVDMVDWSQKLMAIHGTTIESLLSILNDGEIHSYAELESVHPEIPRNRQSRQTDELDINLGLHQYVFWNVGRVHPAALHDVYLCARNDLIEQPDNLVSMREIANLGALVSPEAQHIHREQHRGSTSAEIERINHEAAQKFFKLLVQGSDFSPLFARFLQKHYPESIAAYWADLCYPGTKLSITEYRGVPMVSGTWEGPQLMTPGSVPSEKVQSLLIATTDRRKIDRIMNSGFPKEKIFSIRDAIGDYTKFWGRNIEQGFDFPLDKYLYLNAALGDMTDFSFNNRHNIDNTSHLVGFKHMTAIG